MEVADFTDEQIRTFAEKWFQDNPKKRDRFLKELAKGEHKGLRELGRIPLLLSLLCLAFEETMTFLARRVEIYEEALEALLKKWDSSRNITRDESYHKLSLGRKRQMFARIAAETFEKSDYFLRQTGLAKQIVAYLQQLPPADKDEEVDGDTVLKAIEAQHGIFVERAHRIYSFSHLTFQEYFTAKYIADNAAHGTIKGLIDNHLTDERWREVFLLTASLLDNADSFFTLFRRAIDGLVADDETLIKLLNWVTNKAKVVVNAPFKPSVIRSAYCVLVRALAQVSPLTLEFTITFDQVPNRYRALVSALDTAVNRTFNRAFDPDCDPDCDLNIDFNLTFALQLALIFSRSNPDEFHNTQDKTLQFANYFAEAFAEVVNLSQQAGLPNLHHALSNLTVPNENDRQTMWQTFAINLREIMQIHQDIGHEWNLTKEQIKCLKYYLNSTIKFFVTY